MIILGIECTAHTFGAAVITGKKEILSDCRDTYTSDTHGIIPAECAQHHRKVGHQLVKEALQQANVSKVDLIAYSAAPGLPPCLRAGLEIAKEVAESLNAPLLGVNHAAAHLSSVHMFTPIKNPVYLYISGANTMLVTIENQRFCILGETLDIALGNALDKFARSIGIGFPGGPKVEQLARTGKYKKLPYSVKGMDISLSGMVTHLQTLLKKRVPKEDLCFSFQETAFAMVTEVAERALAFTQKNELALIGGVAANKRLCEMLSIMCQERAATFFAVPVKYAADNAVMIAFQGLLEYQAGRKEENTNIHPYQRLDEVKAAWVETGRD